MESIFFIVIAFIFGAFISYIFIQNKSKKSAREQLNTIQEKDIQLATLKERLDKSIEVFQEIKLQLENERKTKEKLQIEVSIAETQNKNLMEKLQHQKDELQELQQKFTTEFKNIAHDILKINTQQFSESNQKQIAEILFPLREKIQLFEKRVNDVHTEETKQRSELKQHLLHLMEANKTITQEAQNLTKALKADTKAQGNWGEMVLERILENSGLVKEYEYKVQYSDVNKEGVRIQPDVVVFLPDQKHIIIDSKVSLVAYEKYISSEIPEEKQSYLKEHILSVKNHIKNLSSKDYISSSTLKLPDFILLFMPIEGAFSLAIQHDSSIYQEAWEKQIVLVSPTTLMATLKTIHYIWTQDKQTKNALEIASQAGSLYDKFVGFLDDMQKIDKSIEVLNKTYQEAINKLKNGKGNIIGRIEKLKQLGVKSEKNIPGAFKTDEINEE